jgi:predicted transcriptional regulator
MATVAPLPVEAASNGPSVTFYLSVSVLLMVMVVGVGGNTERGRLFLLALLFIPLYTKMKKNTVLEHYTRGQIHGYIVANPGDHYNSIKEALKLNNGTLAYHLRVLEKEGVIKSRSDGVFKRFYPSGMKVVENDGDNLTEIQKIIIKHVNETPGISQKDLSHLLGVSPSTVNYHIGILITKGILHSERRGMRVGYFIDRPEVVEGIKNEKRMEKRALKRARSSEHHTVVMPGGGEHE